MVDNNIEHEESSYMKRTTDTYGWIKHWKPYIYINWDLQNMFKIVIFNKNKVEIINRSLVYKNINYINPMYWYI